MSDTQLLLNDVSRNSLDMMFLCFHTVKHWGDIRYSIPQSKLWGDQFPCPPVVYAPATLPMQSPAPCACIFEFESDKYYPRFPCTLLVNILPQRQVRAYLLTASSAFFQLCLCSFKDRLQKCQHACIISLNCVFIRSPSRIFL